MTESTTGQARPDADAGPGRVTDAGAKGGATGGQNEPHMRAAERIAREFGVSASTVKRAGKLYEFCERRPDIRQAVMQGTITSREVRKEMRKELGIVDTPKTSLTIMSRIVALHLLGQAAIQQAKELKDDTLTAKYWVQCMRKGQEAIQHCRSYALYAERRLGQMLMDMEKTKGGAK